MNFQSYSASAYGYWDRSRTILSHFERCRHQLIYAAFELRCSIEAFLYDYLDFLHDGELPKKLRKLYLAKDLRAEILTIEPHFAKRVEFENLIHRAMGLDVVVIPVPDLTRLGYLYGRLSEYLHIPKGEMDNMKWNALEALINEAQAFLHDLVHPQKSRVKLTDHGIALFEDFRTGRRAADDVVATLEADLNKYFAAAKYAF